METGPLAHEGAVAEAEMAQLPDQEGIEVGPIAEVAEKAVLAAAETAGAQTNLKRGQPGPPLLAAELLQRGVHQGLVLRQLRPAGDALGEQVRKWDSYVDERDGCRLPFQV